VLARFKQRAGWNRSITARQNRVKNHPCGDQTEENQPEMKAFCVDILGIGQIEQPAGNPDSQRVEANHEEERNERSNGERRRHREPPFGGHIASRPGLD
jgi:hypothetical protein